MILNCQVARFLFLWIIACRRNITVVVTSDPKQVNMPQNLRLYVTGIVTILKGTVLAKRPQPGAIE